VVGLFLGVVGKNSLLLWLDGYIVGGFLVLGLWLGIGAYNDFLGSPI
jgi:hypothetical protein